MVSVLRTLRLALTIFVSFWTASSTFAGGPDGSPSRRYDWRRDALETTRVATADHLLSNGVELAAYRSAGFNTLVVYDVNGYNDSGTSWTFKSEEQISAETAFARANGVPLILGLAVESYVAAASKISVHGRFATATHSVVPNGSIPQATDSEIRERLQLWKKYGDGIVIGVFPWYDDVFWQKVDADRQRHVYHLIKATVADWYVFGMIGDAGFNASASDVTQYYDPAAFDHLIVLMYPLNIGAAANGFPLDNVASSDPDGDMIHYVDRYVARMNERFFSGLRSGQLILLVVQAFYYLGEPEGHIPRPTDIAIMATHGTEQLRKISGQQRNHSAAYYYWGAEGSGVVGLSQRSDWLAAVHDVNDGLEREHARRALQP